MVLSSFLEKEEFLDLRRLNNPKDYYDKKGVPRRDLNRGPPVPKVSALSVMLAGPGRCSVCYKLTIGLPGMPDTPMARIQCLSCEVNVLCVNEPAGCLAVRGPPPPPKI